MWPFSSCLCGSVMWYLGAFLIAIQLYKWARFFGTSAQQTVERYTAPVLTTPLPKVNPGTPSLSPMNPRIQGEPDVIQCYDKCTNAPLGTVRVVDKDNVHAIVKRARVAQVKWAKTSFSTRRKLLFSLMNYVVSHQEDICRASSLETGKTMMDGALGEIITTLEKLRWTCAQGEDVLAEDVRDVGLITMHKRAAVSYMPLGVIGAIVSWNYPFHNIFGPMISALFAGNAFVGKVSEYASYFAHYYQSVVREGLEKLGQDPDLVSFLTGFAQTGEALVETADKVTFIGSPGVGKLVMAKASHTLTPVVLELGGKDPAVIMEDADLSQVIPIIMRGTFQNCGQNCVGLERVVLHAKIYDRVVEILEKKVKALTQGTATSEGSLVDTGAMTMGPLAVNKIGDLIKASVAQGARALVGGESQSSNFFPPTLLVDCKKDMPVALEECFGPIMAVYKYHTDEEAIEIINACPYGLGSNIFTGDVARGQAMAKQLQVGMCNINDFAINYLCQSMPFGGCKISGFDRFAGVEGLRGNCLVRSQTTDRIPGVKTQIPALLDYPLCKNTWPFVEALNKVLFGNMAQFVAAAAKLATLKKN